MSTRIPVGNQPATVDKAQLAQVFGGFGEMVDAPIVTRAAIQNAASIAAMMLTTEALITDIPEKDHVSAPAMPE